MKFIYYKKFSALTIFFCLFSIKSFGMFPWQNTSQNEPDRSLLNDEMVKKLHEKDRELSLGFKASCVTLYKNSSLDKTKLTELMNEQIKKFTDFVTSLPDDFIKRSFLRDDVRSMLNTRLISDFKKKIKGYYDQVFDKLSQRDELINDLIKSIKEFEDLSQQGINDPD